MRGRVWVVVCVALATTACADDAAEKPLVLADVPVECPELPDGLEAGGFAAWPHEAAGDLVPDLASLCETPVAAHLLPLLNEGVFWNVDGIEAAAYGVLHRGGDAVGTFLVVRLKPETPGLGMVAYEGVSGGARTTVGEVELVWRATGDHVVVEWVDGRDRVAIASESEDLAYEAVARWLEAAGHGPVGMPDDIPEAGESYAALEAGPPLAGPPTATRRSRSTRSRSSSRTSPTPSRCSRRTWTPSAERSSSAPAAS